jgi:hypothetical protein
MAASPDSDEWYTSFYSRTGFGKVMRYWLRHPGEAVDALRADLVYHAHDLRQANIANFRREDGYPPFARSTAFASWSNFRTALYKRWPAHIVVWYALMIAASVSICIRQPRSRGPAIICLGICGMAVSEFLLASLADAIETERHLFLFHVMTEISICFAAAWALHAFARIWNRRGRLDYAGSSDLASVRAQVSRQRLGLCLADLACTATVTVVVLFCAPTVRTSLSASPIAALAGTVTFT